MQDPKEKQSGGKVAPAGLTRDEVLRIAFLARLKLTDEEVEIFRTRLGRVLEYVHELNQVEAPNDGFVRHVPRDAVAFREDRPLPFGAVPSLLENAPELESNQFVLPPVVEQS